MESKRPLWIPVTPAALRFSEQRAWTFTDRRTIVRVALLKSGSWFASSTWIAGSWTGGPAVGMLEALNMARGAGLTVPAEGPSV